MVYLHVLNMFPRVGSALAYRSYRPDLIINILAARVSSIDICHRSANGRGIA